MCLSINLNHFCGPLSLRILIFITLVVLFFLCAMISINQYSVNHSVMNSVYSLFEGLHAIIGRDPSCDSSIESHRLLFDSGDIIHLL